MFWRRQSSSHFDLCCSSACVLRNNRFDSCPPVSHNDEVVQPSLYVNQSPAFRPARIAQEDKNARATSGKYLEIVSSANHLSKLAEVSGNRCPHLSARCSRSEFYGGFPRRLQDGLRTSWDSVASKNDPLGTPQWITVIASIARLSSRCLLPCWIHPDSSLCQFVAATFNHQQLQ